MITPLLTLRFSAIYQIVAMSIYLSVFSSWSQSSSPKNTSQSGEKLATVSRDGTVLALIDYETSSGKKVLMIEGGFVSSQAAEQELQYRLANSIKIVEQSIQRDSSGANIGRRVLAEFRDRKVGEKYYQILTTKGRDFYCLRSSTIESLLEIEKKVYKASPQ